MDQMPSKSIDQERIDQNNNGCACSNISIMQLFHEMKQEFPKVPDHIVQQLVAENCHNRRACLEQLQKVSCSTASTPTMYPSKIIHNNSNNNNPFNNLNNGVKWSNSQRMRELSEKFENTSINSSSSSSCSEVSSEFKAKRPTTLPLRRAPDPPMTSHNVTLDSTASKINDSLNVQLNVTVSPISAKSPIVAKRPAPPPPPIKPKYTTQLSVQPEPPFTSMLDQAKNLPSNSATNSGKKSFTSVNFTLRQPTPIIPSSQTPIEIQAGPQSLTYSSTSFNAKQGYESHLTITVAGNGESCIQAVRTLPPNSSSHNELNQIDTTINIEAGSPSGSCHSMYDENPPIRIIANPYSQLALPGAGEQRLVDDTELRLHIQRQVKQKQSLECELGKEREKLQMIKLDIVTLTSPCMSHSEMKELCDEITRLRSVCERLTDEIDVITETASRSPHSINSPNAPPPIPRELRSRKSNTQNPIPQLDTSRMQYPSSLPPSYNEVMMRGNSSPSPRPTSNDEKWTCSMCTFRNHSLLQICEACELPRIQGITVTSSSYQPLLQNNQLQSSAH